MSKKKKTAVAIGVLALIGIGLWATTTTADDDERPDDDEDDDRPGPFPATPVDPIGPFPAQEVCTEGQVWSDKAQACVTPVVYGPVDPGEDPTVVVNRYLCPAGPQCRDGSLYVIKSGDRPERIARYVLENVVPEDTTHTLVAPYVGQMAVHSFNHGLYSCIWTPDDPNAPATNSRKGQSGRPPRTVVQRYTAKEYDPEGVMRRWYIGDAFFSRKHKNNLTRLRAGKEPLRTTDEYGRKLDDGSSYGLIWLPRITGHRIGMHASIGVEPDVPPDLAALAPNIYG